jgi:hypothetical protein
MGFTNDTAMAAFVPASKIGKSAGTWTPTLASNTVGDVRTAGAATFNLFVPLNPPVSNSVGLKGARIKSVELLYSVATAALNSVTTVEIEKMTVSSAGAVTGVAVTATLNSTEDTTAKRLTVANHRVIATITSPAWTDNDESYWLYVTFDAAATSAVTLWGAVVNYDLRV